jgi:hypothetical protein
VGRWDARFLVSWPRIIFPLIAEGQEFSAPNNVKPDNPAIRYELNGKFVVRNEVTKEIIQISDEGFKPNKL